MVLCLMKLELVMIGHDLITGKTHILRKILPERKMFQRKNRQNSNANYNFLKEDSKKVK